MERVSARFWREAEAFGFEQPYQRLRVPSQITFGTLDHFVPLTSMKAIVSAGNPHGDVRIIEGLTHSSWPVALGDAVVAATKEFLLRCLPQVE